MKLCGRVVCPRNIWWGLWWAWSTRGRVRTKAFCFNQTLISLNNQCLVVCTRVIICSQVELFHNLHTFYMGHLEIKDGQRVPWRLNEESTPQRKSLCFKQVVELSTFVFLKWTQIIQYSIAISIVENESPCSALDIKHNLCLYCIKSILRLVWFQTSN